MPVTSRGLQIKTVNGAGKKLSPDLRYDPAKRQLINVNCGCIIRPPLPPITTPPPITTSYTTAGSYTIVLPDLPTGYAWQISGTVTSGGGGGGGGGGGSNLGFIFLAGGGGFVSGIFQISFSDSVSGGTSITSVVGAGGAGGEGGLFGNPGKDGSTGSISSIEYNTVYSSSPPTNGGLGGIVFGGNSNAQIGGSQSGSGGSGGNGSTVSGSPGSPGEDGKDGSVIFTAVAKAV